MIQDAGAAAVRGAWSIVIVRDGLSANSMSLTDGASLYDPEQDVLAFGAILIRDSTLNTMSFEGNTKTMRKLKMSDKLVFLATGIATNTFRVGGIIQLFCKT